MEVFQPDDRFFRKVMKNPENARAYINEYYPKIALKLDMETLRSVDTTFLSSKLKVFESDIIYRARYKGRDEEQYISLIWEHKSQPDDYVCIQVGLYLYLAMYEMVNDKDKTVEPVLPLIFYNGKEDFQPKTIYELFEDHPFSEDFKKYLPNFEFLFLNISKQPLEKILAINNQFFMRAMLAMANRHRPDLLIQNISIIFDIDNEDQLATISMYFLGVIERSPETFQKEVEKQEWPVKNNIMSTLEQILQKGRKEGMEKGMQKGMQKGEQKGVQKGKQEETLKFFFKTLLHFPEASSEKLAELAGLPLDKVNELLQKLNQNTTDQLLDHIQNTFFKADDLRPEFLEELRSLVDQVKQRF